ncbi:MAG: VPLPA-CTERM-specific exosortase XrtD [Thermodesulfobacteriota bacterium]
MKALLTIRPVGWVKGIIYGLLLAGMYYSTLTWLVTKDWTREAYSYGYLIPFVVLYLIWMKRGELSSLPSLPSWKGFAPFVLGLIFFWLGELSGELFSLYISFWLVLVGICWMHLGRQKLKTIGFALVFILTMFPLPNFVLNRVTLKLRLISSQLGVVMMQLFGMPVYREGNVIDLGFTQLQVVEACSGLHSLISLMVLCLLLVYFFRAHFWKRAVLLISAVPLAVFANSMRITLTGILYKVWGPKIAEGFFHGFSGWLIFVFCIPVLLFEMKILERLPPVTSATSDLKEAKNSSLKAQSNEVVVQRSWLNARFIVIVILLAMTLAVSQGVEFRERIPITRPLNQFPLQIGEWFADGRQAMDKVFIDELDLSDHAIIDYRNSHGRQVNFYVAYYESQSKGKSIHSPETCLPGSGWIFKQAGTIPVSLSSGDNRLMHVNRAFMEKAGRKQLVYYWFYQRGRILTNAYQLKVFAFWDALTKQRTDGALVRLMTPVDESEGLGEAEAGLQKFTGDVAPLLERYLPK